MADLMLDATALKAHKGTRLVLNGQLREYVCFDIHTDRHPVRWDTLIDGQQVQAHMDTTEIITDAQREWAKQAIISRWMEVHGG